MAADPAEIAFRLQEKTGHCFHDPLNACSALLTSYPAGAQLRGFTSHRNSVRLAGTDGNKLLALLGDAILRFVIVEQEYDYNTFPGIISGNADVFSSDKNLSRHAWDHKLHDLVIMDPTAPVDITAELMATVVKAIQAAVYIDSNRSMIAVKQVVRTLQIIPKDGLKLPSLFP